MMCSSLWAPNFVCMHPPAAWSYLHAPTGPLELSAERRLVVNCQLADLLRFSWNTFEPGKPHTADKPHQLAVYREVCMHLAEISISENLHNGRPSTLLRSIPVENEMWGRSDVNISPLAVQTASIGDCFSTDPHGIKDVDNKELDFDHLSAVLHIRNVWRGWPWERQQMPRAGFSRSGGYQRIQKGWRREPAVCIPAVRPGVLKKESRHPRGRWGAEALRAEQGRCFICRPQAAPHAGIYWEQVGRLCGLGPRNGVAHWREGLGSLHRNRAGT